MIEGVREEYLLRESGRELMDDVRYVVRRSLHRLCRMKEMEVIVYVTLGCFGKYRATMVSASSDSFGLSFCASRLLARLTNLRMHNKFLL